MVQIAGKYVNEKNENLLEYVKGLGMEITDEMAAKIDSSRATIDITVNGDNCTITSSSGRGATFTFGKAFDDEVLPGVKVNSIATLNGNKVEIKSTAADNRSGTRIYEFSDSGLVVNYISAHATAKRFYKRA